MQQPFDDVLCVRPSSAMCVVTDGEGVIYALSEAAANMEMCTSCGSEGDDLVLLNEREEPTEVGTLL
jgi:hypothetical protein